MTFGNCHFKIKVHVKKNQKKEKNRQQSCFTTGKSLTTMILHAHNLESEFAAIFVFVLL